MPDDTLAEQLALLLHRRHWAGHQDVDCDGPTGRERADAGPEWTCRKCGCRLAPCVTCGQPAQCGESWCPGHGPVDPEGTPDADA